MTPKLLSTWVLKICARYALSLEAKLGAMCGSHIWEPRYGAPAESFETIRSHSEGILVILLVIICGVGSHGISCPIRVGSPPPSHTSRIL